MYVNQIYMAMKSPELIAEFWTSPTLRKHFIISTLPKSMKFKSSRLLFCNQIPQNFFLNPKPTKVINFSTDSLPNTLKIEKKNILSHFFQNFFIFIFNFPRCVFIFLILIGLLRRRWKKNRTIAVLIKKSIYRNF